MKLQVKLFPVLFFLAYVLLPETSLGQLKAVPFEEIASLQKADPRPMVIFIHTDWCKYCQGMKNTTFKNDHVVQLLNNNFYFLDLNAEEKRNIRFHQKTFKYKPRGNNTGVNELAEQLGSNNGKLSYPTLCILNADYEIIYQHHEFIDSRRLIKMLEQLKEDSRH
jgi:thioredoxin-related protein